MLIGHLIENHPRSVTISVVENLCTARQRKPGAGSSAGDTLMDRYLFRQNSDKDSERLTLVEEDTEHGLRYICGLDTITIC